MSYTIRATPNFNPHFYPPTQTVTSHTLSREVLVSSPECLTKYQTNQFPTKEVRDNCQITRNEGSLSNGERKPFDFSHRNGTNLSTVSSHTFGDQFQNNSLFNANKSMCEPDSFAFSGQTIKRNSTVANLAFYDDRPYESEVEKIPVLKQERRNIKNGETYVLSNPIKSLRSLNEGSLQTLPDETTEVKYEQLKSYKSLREIDTRFRDSTVNEVENDFDSENCEIPFELSEISSKLKLMKLEKQNLIKDQEKLNEEFSQISEELTQYEESSAKMEEECKEFKSKEEKLKEKIERLEKMILEAKKESKDDEGQKKFSKEHDNFMLAFDLKNKDIATLNAEAFFSETYRDQTKKEVSAERQRNLAAKLTIEETYENEDREKSDEVNKLKKALEIMENKLQTALKENKKKDEFLQQNLKSKLKANEEKEYVSCMIKKYKSMFPKNLVAEKLGEEENEIAFLRTMIKEKNERK